MNDEFKAVVGKVLGYAGCLALGGAMTAGGLWVAAGAVAGWWLVLTLVIIAIGVWLLVNAKKMASAAMDRALANPEQ